MSIATAKSATSTLTQTVTMLEMLSDEELQAIQSVARVFIARMDDEDPFRPMSAEEIEKKITITHTELDQKRYQDSEEVEAEIAAEFNLV